MIAADAINGTKIADDSVDSEDLPHPPGIRFLPENISELQARAKELIIKFADGKYKYRNEIVSILDELFRRGKMSLENYNKVNNFLSSKDDVGSMSDDSESEEEMSEDEEETITRKIIDTLQYLTRHDRREIESLLTLFAKEGKELWEEDMEQLRILVDTWFETGDEGILKLIKELLNTMEDLKIPKTKLHRFEWILNDIHDNRLRVTHAIRQLAYELKEDDDYTLKDVDKVLSRLAESGNLSREQYNALKEKMVEEGLSLDDVIWQLKSTKVGRGLKFLPTQTKDLYNSLKEGVARFAEEKTETLRSKLLAYLDELLQRKALNKEDHKDIIELL